MEPPAGEECGDGCGGSNQCELCKDSLKWAARSAAVAVAAEDETTSAAFPATLRLTTQRPLDGEGGKKKNLVYNTHDDDDYIVVIMQTKLTMTMMMMMIVTLSFLCEEVDTSESCWGKNCPIVFVLPDF